MSTKAIETQYKGHRFRSRLEARWAVFFDFLGIEWRYECEGYETVIDQDEEGNGEVVRYLPDFFLPRWDGGIWVEVKGSDALLQNDIGRMDAILDYSSPLPGMMDSSGSITDGFLILGDIPDPTKRGLHFHRIIQHRKGLLFGWAMFVPGHVEIIRDNRVLEFFYDCSSHEMPDWTTQSLYVNSKRYWAEILDAYKAARSARFEHGESP